MSMKHSTEVHTRDQELALNLNATFMQDELAHRVLPYVCTCGYHLVGFTQAWATHETVYAHCVNKDCPEYYNTQDLTYYTEHHSA